MRYLSARVTPETAVSGSIAPDAEPVVSTQPSAATADDRSRVATDTTDVFLAPFAGPDPCLHLQNIANTHPECMYDLSGKVLNAYNLPGPLSEKARRVASIKDTRMLIPTRGNTMVTAAGPSASSDADPFSERKAETLAARGMLDSTQLQLLAKVAGPARNYLLYALEQRLLPPKALEGLLLTESFTDFDEILTKAAATGRTVHPFNPRQGFYDLCDRYGASVYGRTTSDLEYLNDKRRFRDVVAELRPDYFPFPRLFTPATSRPAAAELRELVAYSLANRGDSNTRNVLFIQKTIAGGGAGNFVVATEPDGSFAIPDHAGGLSLEKVADFIASLDTDVEVTPFLRLVATPSIGLIIGNSGITAAGPYTQILNEHNDYIGFTSDIGSGAGGPVSAAAETDRARVEVAEFVADQLPDLLALGTNIGTRQFRAGYRGYASLDTLFYRDGAGILHVTLSEENPRFTGTCMLQMVVHGIPTLRKRLLDGELSMMHHDLVPLSDSVITRTGPSATELADLLRKQDIPLVNDEPGERGVLLMARPCEGIGGMAVGVGVVAGDDGARDELFERVVRIFRA